MLQAQLQTYAGLEEIESIASTCSRSINSRGESETSHGHRLSISNRSTPGDSAHSSPGGNSITGALCMLSLVLMTKPHKKMGNSIIGMLRMLSFVPWELCMLWYAVHQQPQHTRADSAHSSPGGNSITCALCMLSLKLVTEVHDKMEAALH